MTLYEQRIADLAITHGRQHAYDIVEFGASHSSPLTEAEEAERRFDPNDLMAPYVGNFDLGMVEQYYTAIAPEVARGLGVAALVELPQQPTEQVASAQSAPFAA